MPEMPDENLILAELYGVMQTFRQLGFPSESLFLSFRAVASGGPFKGCECVGVCLRWAGKEFNYTVAPVSDQHVFAEHWRRLSTRANEARDPATQALLAEMYASSECYATRDGLVEALIAKGIVPPAHVN